LSARPRPPKDTGSHLLEKKQVFSLTGVQIRTKDKHSLTKLWEIFPVATTFKQKAKKRKEKTQRAAQTKDGKSNDLDSDK